jgi:flagellar basal-body rod protein FlgF
MDNTGYIALSHQIALQRRMEVLANNMANMNTTGYQGEAVMFEQYLYKDIERNRKIAYVQDVGTLRNLNEGAFSPTGNQLDVAIHGRGFLSVQTQAGTRYTRAGNLRIDNDNQLATRDGFKVLDQAGNPITFQPRDKSISISPDGSVSTETGPKGRIALFGFQNEQRLKRDGNGLIRPEDQQPQAGPRGVSLVQGTIEGSNVLPIVEMTAMVDIQRQFEAAGRLQDTLHELRRRAVEKLGKV